jgi:hypothetical protein
VLEDALRRCILQVVMFANAKTEHIPNINFQMETPMIYPFEVRVGRVRQSGSRLSLRESVVFATVGHSHSQIVARPSESSSGWLPRFIKGAPLL